MGEIVAISIEQLKKLKKIVSKNNLGQILDSYLSNLKGLHIN